MTLVVGAGRRRCRSCRRPLTLGSTFAIWHHALVVSHAGHLAGISLGATPSQVLRWAPALLAGLPELRPHAREFFDAVYAVTHYFYVLTDYRQRPLPPGDYHAERSLLINALDHAFAEGDLEMMCESLEALRMAGHVISREPEAKIIKFIRHRQRPDGGWGGGTLDSYTRYHMTWVCLDVLRPHRYAGAPSGNGPLHWQRGQG